MHCSKAELSTPRTKSPTEDEGQSGSDPLGRPGGGPRGLLLYYILSRIALKPSHGYEILRDIEAKTEGAWRPGAGSIYPILKRLEEREYIQADSIVGAESRRTYHITKEGVKRLKEAKETFANFGQRWSLMRGIFIDLIEPEHLETFLTDGAKKQFQFTQDMLNSKIGSLPASSVEYILKDYALNLQRQLDWTNQMLSRLKHKPVKIAS